MERIRSWIEEVISPGYEYEVYMERRKKTTLESADESLENLLRAEEAGIGIRVFKGKKMGFSYTTDLSEASVKECVRTSMQVCDITPEDDGFCLGACQNSGSLKTYYDEDGLKKPLEEKIELIVGLERRAKELDPRVKGVRKISLKEIEREVVCFSSCGLFYDYRGTWYTLMMAVLAEEGSDSSISYELSGSRSLANLPLESIVRDVVFKATASLNPSEMGSVRIPAVLFREASAMLLEAFSSIFLGDALVKGKTFLKDKEETEVFSQKLTIVDDGTLKDGFMTLPVDSEGYKMNKKFLVDKGVFKGFLHSTYTALKSDVEPTGNSLRESFRSLPTSGITNLYIEPGQKSLEELLQRDAFLITDLMGLHTVDPVSGDFSLGASGIIYKGGKMQKSVRGIVIGGNIKDIWSSIVEVGNDIRFYGNVGSPSLLIEGITVGG